MGAVELAEAQNGGMEDFVHCGLGWSISL